MQNKNKITYILLTQTTISILEYFPIFIHYTELSLFFFFNMTEIIVYHKSLISTLTYKNFSGFKLQLNL